MTSPHDIRTRTFRLATRGYDRVEVSEFLGVVAEEVEELLGELDALAARVGVVSSDPSPAAPPVATADATAEPEPGRDGGIIDLRDPFALFGTRSAPHRRPMGAMASFMPPPGEEPALEPSVPLPTSPLLPTLDPAPEPEPVPAPASSIEAAPAPASPIGPAAISEVTSALPPPPVIDLRERGALPAPEQLGRQVAEMLRQAELDATEIRSRALAELEEARRQAAILRADVELQSRQHVDGVLSEFRSTLGRLAQAEREARDRLREINEQLTIILAGALPDQETATSTSMGEGSTSTPEAASNAWPTDT